MVASQQELECIEISRELRNRLVQRKIEDSKKDWLPIFLSPVAFANKIDSKLTSFDNKIALWRLLIVYFVLAILYIMFVPISFFYGLYLEISGAKRRKIKEIKHIFFLDEKVSDKKSFSQLWDDKGLRDYGHEYWIYSGYTREEQKECIYKWFSVLYGDISSLKELELTVRESQAKTAREFDRMYPDGHISLAPIESILPTEIDKRFGSYIQSEKVFILF